MNLDMDVLRTLVAADRLGGFNRAATQVGRSQSAVSQQLKRLEDQLGEPLFRKQGRNLTPTEAGDIVLAYARRILALNDEAVSAVRGRAVEGSVRLGLPADLAEAWLPAALGRFRRGHPGVWVELVIDRNRILLERLDRAELDLVLGLGHGARDDADRLAELPMHWIGSVGPSPWQIGQPVPLVLFEPPCFFRLAGLSALDRVGTPWRVAVTSPSLQGVWAAVEAGLGFTVRTALNMPKDLRVLDPDALGLPGLNASTTALCMHAGGRTLEPAARQLRAILAETVAEGLAALGPLPQF